MPHVNSPKMQDLTSALGSRVTIRLHEKSGGYRDIVGILQSKNEIVNSHGQTVFFNSQDVAIWRLIKPLPDRAGTGAPLSLRISELEEISNSTWQADREVHYGKWIARLSQGFTVRANSVLPRGAGPFGEPLEAIERSIDFIQNLYKEAGLTPAFVLPLPVYSELDSLLHLQGWTQKLVVQYLVNESVTIKPEARDDVIFSHSRSPQDHWLRVQGDENLLPIMSRTPALYGAIHHKGVIVGVGRIAVVGSWSIVSRLYIVPEYRGKGLSKFLMNNLTHAAFIEGATKVFLQVDALNTVALALYESMGFRYHHTCSYRELQSEIKP
jgi:GNAT superfamily N-acetyltransferase